MSTQVFPTIPGLDIVIHRTPAWTTLIQEAVSGKETRVARRLFPRRTWELTVNFLRMSTSFSEFQNLEAFFNNRAGAYDSFLYADGDDNSVTSQALGLTNGTSTSYQLARSYGGFSEPMYAPNSVSNVYISGATSTVAYTVTGWGTTSPGTINFASAPAAGHALSADFTYYFPVRFSDDTMMFDKIVYNIWEAKKISFVQIV